MKKKAFKLILALGLAAGGLAGLKYYLDYVRLPAVPPRQVIERYFEALKQKDHEKAFAMVSHRQYPDSFRQFVDRVSQYAPDMVLEFIGETIENDKAEVEMDISVPMAFGVHKSQVRMILVREQRDWKINHP